jgi:hypothetical protein
VSVTASDHDAASIARWILAEPCGDDSAVFARKLAEQLVASGFPLWRLRYALMTMHPEVLWRSVLSGRFRAFLWDAYARRGL